jgi:hypothetical protein
MNSLEHEQPAAVMSGTSGHQTLDRRGPVPTCHDIGEANILLQVMCRSRSSSRAVDTGLSNGSHPGLPLLRTCFGLLNPRRSCSSSVNFKSILHSHL